MKIIHVGNVRAIAVALATSTFALTGCGAAGDNADSQSSEIASRAGSALQPVDHAAFAPATDANAKKSGITKWRLGAQATDVVIDAMNAVGKTHETFRIRQASDARTNAAVTIVESETTGHRMVIGADGKLESKSTFTPAETALLDAIAKDVNESKSSQIEVAYLSWGGFWRALKAAATCAAAAAQDGANPYTDAACVASVGDVVTHGK